MENQCAGFSRQAAIDYLLHKSMATPQELNAGIDGSMRLESH